MDPAATVASVLGSAFAGGAVSEVFNRARRSRSRVEDYVAWRQRVEDRLEQLDELDLAEALSVITYLKARYPELRLPINRERPIWDRRRKGTKNP